jgi:hypothetical protein
MNRQITIRFKARWVHYALVALLAALVAFPAGVMASDRFPDVPFENIFHDDINAIADAGVTLGFPDGTYHPLDLVTREQMAAFMNRLGALGPGKTPVVNAKTAQTADTATDADNLDGLDGLDYVLALEPTALTSFPALISLVGGQRSECTAVEGIAFPLNSYTIHYQLYATPDAATLPPELVNVQTRIEETGADTSSLQVCLATLQDGATLLAGDYEANAIFTVFLEGGEAASLSLEDVRGSELQELSERP